MQMQPTNIIQFIFVFQMIFGVFLIWKNTRYRGLSYLLIFAACSMVFNLLEELSFTRDIYLITPVFLLGKGPLVYLFVYQLIYPEKQISKAYVIHLSPMFVGVLFTQWPQLVIAVGSISQFIYAYFSIGLILFYHKASLSMRSDADSLQLFWLIKVLLTFLVIGVLDLIRLNLQPYIGLNINLVGQLFENTAVLLLFSYLIYKAVQHPLLFSGVSEYERIALHTNQPIEQANDELTMSIFQSIDQLIRAKSLHHKPRLSLNDLAEETGLTTRDISQAMNQHAEGSFCDYVNKLRVGDLKQKLLEKPDANKSILAMAFEVGFNSKSSLNLIFKRETSFTPSQYMKNNQ